MSFFIFADVIKKWFLDCKLHIIQWQVTNCYYFSRGTPWYKSQLHGMCRTRDSRAVFTLLPSCFAHSENQAGWSVNEYCQLIDYRTCWTKGRSMKQILYIGNFTISWKMIINISQCYELSHQSIFALSLLVSLLLILRVSWTFQLVFIQP